ncbi:hypothetical protein [Pelagibacterium xiamenense]|uniref:hypothetical protein n=1 Tax=Pelagibacterium xiamenense TaxID=2901140 RepID=UPI001E53CC21|nr:hypothetical protein [Pelagibacterium xiamenense]MCD7059298.1 hypothetical protein [Pelagibacterium xiamenense]
MRPARYKPAHHSTLIAPHIRVAVAFLFICVALLGASGAFADEDAPLSNLVTFEGRDYDVTAEDWVSLEPTSTASVRKIGYGKVTEVNIATTATGVYSSDAIVSPYVQYPGIEVRPVFSPRKLWQLVSEATLSYRGTRGTSSSILIWGEAPNGLQTYTRITDLGLHSCMSGGSFMACYTNR